MLYCHSKRKTNADLAHLVERNLAKVEVAGSSPVIRSKQKTEGRTMFFLFSLYKKGEGGLERGASSAETEFVIRSKQNPLSNGLCSKGQF